MAKSNYLSVVSKEFNSWQEHGRAESMQNEHYIAAQAAIKDMNLTDNMKVLDIGCGNGYTVRIMAEKVTPNGQAYGVDISENMVNSAINLSKNFNNTEFKVGNYANLPFENHLFDMILSVESIYYAENMLEALKEVKRTLKPGGKFYCVTYFYKEHPNSAVWADMIPITMHYLSETEYIKLFKKAGFSEITTKRVYDTRPIDKDAFKPGWGYETLEEVIYFRENIGALLVAGTYVRDNRTE